MFVLSLIAFTKGGFNQADTHMYCSIMTSNVKQPKRAIAEISNCELSAVTYR